MTQNLKFDVGEVVVATAGIYSDYGIEGFFVVIQAFDMRPLAIEYVTLRRAQYDQEDSGLWEGSDKDYEGFIGWLVAKELVVPVSYRTVDLGDYDGFYEEFGVPEREEIAR